MADDHNNPYGVTALLICFWACNYLVGCAKQLTLQLFLLKNIWIELQGKSLVQSPEGKVPKLEL